MHGSCLLGQHHTLSMLGRTMDVDSNSIDNVGTTKTIRNILGVKQLLEKERFQIH